MCLFKKNFKPTKIYDRHKQEYVDLGMAKIYKRWSTPELAEYFTIYELEDGRIVKHIEKDRVGGYWDVYFYKYASKQKYHDVCDPKIISIDDIESS